MSLRARLTLLYTILVGGTLLIFGLAIYQWVSLTITEQIDQILERTASNIISAIRVNAISITISTSQAGAAINIFK